MTLTRRMFGKLFAIAAFVPSQSTRVIMMRDRRAGWTTPHWWGSGPPPPPIPWEEQTRRLIARGDLVTIPLWMVPAQRARWKEEDIRWQVEGMGLSEAQIREVVRANA